MLFDKNTFIVPVTSTDTKVFLKSTDGVVVFIIDPTNVVNIFTAANSIRIKTKSDLHVLDFNNNINAIAALPLLKAALDSVVIHSTTIIGGGTFNYVTKFTPDGISVGNSILYDTGSRLGIGTITPSGLLHIKSLTGTTFRAETSTGALFNINDNNTVTYTGFNVSFTGGNVGIGTNAPTSTLHVAGTFKYVDGNQTAGYILTSDVNGNATWHAPTSTITKYSAMSVAITANLTLPIVHNIGNTAITINVWDTLTGDMILGFDANNRTINSVDITLSVTGNYDIVIIG